MKKFRHSKRGIVLLTTLVSVALLAGLATAISAKSVRNVQLLSRAAQEHNAATMKDTVRSFARPLIAEAVVAGDGSASLRLNSTPFVMTIGESTATLLIQDAAGILWPNVALGEDMKRQMPTELLRMVEEMDISQTLSVEHALALAGVERDRVREWQELTTLEQSRRFNIKNAHEGLRISGSAAGDQVRKVRMKIEY